MAIECANQWSEQSEKEENDEQKKERKKPKRVKFNAKQKSFVSLIIIDVHTEYGRFAVCRL